MNSPGPRLLLALYEPDIAQNAGAMMRTCACLGVDAAIIEPAGFRIGDSRFRRAGMDYLDAVSVARHDSWARFEAWRSGFRPEARAADDQGRIEALGLRLPSGRHPARRPGIRLECRTRSPQSADARLRIPIRPPLRSLNVGIAAAIALVEALRQIDGLP